MNPLRRRSQVFLALAATHQGHDLNSKRQEEIRLDKAKRLLRLVKGQLRHADVSEEIEQALRQRKRVLEEKIKEKKKDL